MRKIIITKQSYVISPRELSSCSHVKKYWLLPRGYMLIETIHPAFRNGNNGCSTGRQLAAALVEEASLFVPFYRHTRSLADIITLQVRCSTASYHLVATSSSVLQWPKWLAQNGWEDCRIINTICKLSTPSPIRLLKTIFIEWRNCMSGMHELTHFHGCITKQQTYVARCEFSGPCGDAIMALLMLLAESNVAADLESVSFRLRLKEQAPVKRETTRPTSQFVMNG